MVGKKESRVVVATSCGAASIALVFRGPSRVEKAFAVFGSTSELASIVESSSVFEEINYCLEARSENFCSSLKLPRAVVEEADARLMLRLAEIYCGELARYAGFEVRDV